MFLENIKDFLMRKGSEYGIDWKVLYSIVGMESGFDNTLVGDSGDSYGLFQINVPSHANFDVSKYTNPEYQADYQLPELKKFYDKGLNLGLSGLNLAKYVEVYGQRPDYTGENKVSIDTSMKKYWDEAELDKSIANYWNNTTGMVGKAADSVIGNLWDNSGVKTAVKGAIGWQIDAVGKTIVVVLVVVLIFIMLS
jgi:hypothetical protein